MQKNVKGKEKKNISDQKKSATRSQLRPNPSSEIEEIEVESCPDININISSKKSSKPSRYFQKS